MSYPEPSFCLYTKKLRFAKATNPFYDFVHTFRELCSRYFDKQEVLHRNTIFDQAMKLNE